MIVTDGKLAMKIKAMGHTYYQDDYGISGRMLLFSDENILVYIFRKFCNQKIGFLTSVIN